MGAAAVEFLRSHEENEVNFPVYNGVISGPLSRITTALVDAVKGFYTGNMLVDGVLRIPALFVSTYATGSANFGA